MMEIFRDCNRWKVVLILVAPGTSTLMLQTLLILVWCKSVVLEILILAGSLKGVEITSYQKPVLFSQ